MVRSRGTEHGERSRERSTEDEPLAEIVVPRIPGIGPVQRDEAHPICVHLIEHGVGHGGFSIKLKYISKNLLPALQTRRQEQDCVLLPGWVPFSYSALTGWAGANYVAQNLLGWVGGARSWPCPPSDA